MNHHLHKEIRLNEAHIVEFQFTGRARVMFLDNDNYFSYQQGYDYDFYGTETDQSPFYMAAPHRGWWHLVVESVEPSSELQVHIRIHEN